jgi:hypothetical protein
MKLLLLMSVAVSIASCASVGSDACQLSHPPENARIRVTGGVSLATFPARVPPAYTGCQRTWFGDERELGAMQVLTTAHFSSGQLFRLEGAAPDGAAYDCRYVDGKLSPQSSLNAQRCPLTTQRIEEAAK